MISLYLHRQTFTDKRTLGELSLIDNTLVVAKFYTCEDTVRGGGNPLTVSDWKVKDCSAIPYGTYRCSKTYSQRFGRDMWEVLGVPGFQGIRIHSGNTEADTSGCILLGTTLLPNSGGIGESTAAIRQFEYQMAGFGNPVAYLCISSKPI